MEFQRVVPAITVTQSISGCLGSGANSSFLDILGDVTDASAVLLGHDVHIMCELIRRGCRNVTELQQNDRPEKKSADLIVVPSVGSVEGAVTAIAHARRGLQSAGRVVVRTVAEPERWLGLAIDRTLRLHGFSAIRPRPLMDRIVFSAELSCFSPVGQA